MYDVNTIRLKILNLNNYRKALENYITRVRNSYFDIKIFAFII